jgi:gamma-glutamyltranspeptidase
MLLLLLYLAAVSGIVLVRKMLDMVVTPHPLATAAGEEILRLGGTAA